MSNIVLTNDDGPSSKGLCELAAGLSAISELAVVVPDGQRSATGKALTFNRPLRIHHHRAKDGYRLITHDGTPADSIIIARAHLEKIDLFISGINSGANIGYQSMYTSGTVGAVLEAAMNGHPGIAVSKVASPDEWFNNSTSEVGYSAEVRVVVDIANMILERGLPSGVDALNLNFPSRTLENSRMVVTSPTRLRMTNSLEERIDPNGSPYFWIRGEENDSPRGTDANEVLANGNISISPMLIEAVGPKELQAVIDFMNL
ncbi:MAG: 5'/3'-nucleotidase SurE [Candidatus Thorarchaeota archaeon]|nr:MAG: 5'/3'-nucleotidase SurE [Candidatus Thorarchaeota archaeon]